MVDQTIIDSYAKAAQLVREFSITLEELGDILKKASELYRNSCPEISWREEPNAN